MLSKVMSFGECNTAFRESHRRRIWLLRAPIICFILISPWRGSRVCLCMSYCANMPHSLAKYPFIELSQPIECSLSSAWMMCIVIMPKTIALQPLLSDMHKVQVGYPKCIKPVILGHFVSHGHSGLNSPIFFNVFSKMPTQSHSDTKSSSNERFL